MSSEYGTVGSSGLKFDIINIDYRKNELTLKPITINLKHPAKSEVNYGKRLRVRISENYVFDFQTRGLLDPVEGCDCSNCSAVRSGEAESNAKYILWLPTSGSGYGDEYSFIVPFTILDDFREAVYYVNKKYGYKKVDCGCRSAVLCKMHSNRESITFRGGDAKMARM